MCPGWFNVWGNHGVYFLGCAPTDATVMDRGKTPLAGQLSVKKIQSDYSKAQRQAPPAKIGSGKLLLIVLGHY